jgi:hypothetical protein
MCNCTSLWYTKEIRTQTAIVIPISDGFKLTFADWLKLGLIEELTHEIDVQEKH